MGVPKFYRWLSERYPCLSEIVKEHQIPEFDNFYLDMNGIIHICSHPNDDDPHFRISEQQIFESIFHYVEVLFRMIRPRKVFFLAVDGVAPRAKMNQQRGRRFRSAKEAEQNEKKARDRGEELPKEARFDSNCITPGTPFMARLQDQLKYFISNKISTDPLWQSVNVILSGHDTPGEGEHKIMDYIRFEKSKPDYDPNIRHCLYGLDADLIMLGLCTHDPHFSLLREEVRFGGKKSSSNKRIPNPENTTFHLLHLSLMREYLEHEFSGLKEMDLPFKFDIEAIIDDWILLGFLVGNDFIPHLPHLHINKGALQELYETYKFVLPKIGGYMNESGTLNLPRFEAFMKVLSEKEMERFDDIYSDTKWLEGKTARKGEKGKHKIESTPGPGNVHDILEGSGFNENNEEALTKKDPELLQLLTSVEEFISDDEEEEEFNVDVDEDESSSDSCCDGRDNFYHMEFRQHKHEYYMKKMGYEKVDESVLKEQAEGYVRAIQWNLHYYYNGCISWSWYYPHHFAPWITDIKDFANMEMKFELNEPFLPFEQLMAVLPPASKELLPQALQGLMINQTSPIIDFYPQEFKTDLNGKQQDWEAVVLIPFIEEQRLLSAMNPLIKALRPEEKERNKHGPICIYSYTAEDLGPYSSPAYFPDISRNHAKLNLVMREQWDVPISKLRKGLMDGVRLDVFFPGFPTLAHIPHTAQLKKAQVRVFEQSSRGENMILTLKKEDSAFEITKIAQEYIDQEIWVSWPHMVEAKVVEVSNKDATYKLDKEGKLVIEQNPPEEKADFAKTCKLISEKYKNRWGVDIGPTSIVLRACLMIGRKYVCGLKGNITLEKLWSREPEAFALQATKKDILSHDPSFTQYRSLDELFPEGSSCFMLGFPHYGCQGEVLQVAPSHKGRVQVKIKEPTEPNLMPVIRSKNDISLPYFPGYQAAKQLGVSSHVLSRITGSIFINKNPYQAAKGEPGPDRDSRVNVGLNLKFNKKNEEILGFTRKKNEMWLYSQKAIDTIYEYMEKCPSLFDFLCASQENCSSDMINVMEIFPEEPEESLADLVKWIKSLESSNAPKIPSGTIILETEVVQKIEMVVDENVQKSSNSLKEVIMQVKPHLLFKPNLCYGNALPDDSVTFRLFDRVVNVREGFSVPLGLRGTIIGIHPTTGAKENQHYDVLFDQRFPGGQIIRSSTDRCFRVPASAVINLSHGHRSAQSKPTAVVKPMDTRQEPIKSKRDPETTLKVTRIVKPKENRRAVHSRIIGEKENSQGPTPIPPPDPSNLPNPMDIFKNKPNRSSNKNKNKNKKDPSADPAMLWRNMETESTDKSTQDPQFLSSQLKTMLKISNQVSATQRQRHSEAAVNNPSNTVEEFFKSASGLTGVALPPIAGPLQQCTTLRTLLEQNRLGFPKYTFHDIPFHGGCHAQLTLPWGPSFQTQLPFPTRDEAGDWCAGMALDLIQRSGLPPKQNAQQITPSDQHLSHLAPPFVPMQVSKKRIARGGGGGAGRGQNEGRKNEPEVSDSAASTSKKNKPQRPHQHPGDDNNRPKKPTGTDPKNHGANNQPHHSETRKGRGRGESNPRGRGRGGRGRGRVAANFGNARS